MGCSSGTSSASSSSSSPRSSVSSVDVSSPSDSSTSNLLMCLLSWCPLLLRTMKTGSSTLSTSSASCHLSCYLKTAKTSRGYWRAAGSNWSKSARTSSSCRRMCSSACRFLCSSALSALSYAKILGGLLCASSNRTGRALISRCYPSPWLKLLSFASRIASIS